MIYWLRLLGLIFMVICVIAVIGSLLPRSYDFEVKQTIAASPQQIYQEVETLPKWQSWSQWSLDNQTVQSLEYSADGLSQTWTDERGDGSLWITDRTVGRSISYSMTFADFPEMQSTITLEPQDNQSTEVRWRSRGQLPGGPFYGYFSPFFSTGMKSHYQHGLGKLAKMLSLTQHTVDETPTP